MVKPDSVPILPALVGFPRRRKLSYVPRAAVSNAKKTAPTAAKKPAGATTPKTNTRAATSYMEKQISGPSCLDSILADLIK